MSTTSTENSVGAIAEELALFCWVITRTAVVDLVAGKTELRSPTSARAHDLDCAWKAGPSVAFHLAWMRAPHGDSNKGGCKWGWDLSGGESMLRSLNGGRLCNATLPTRTVGDMKRQCGHSDGEEKDGGIASRICGCRSQKNWHRCLTQTSQTTMDSPLPRNNRLIHPDHNTPHLLLLLSTPASNGLVHLTWSTVVVAKRCTSAPTTPQHPST